MVLQIPGWIEIIFCYIVLKKTRLREIINWMVDATPAKLLAGLLS